MTYTKEKLIEAAISLPYGDQCKNFDLTSEPDAIRFDWRGNRFRVSNGGRVEEAGNGVLIDSDLAILASHLIKLTFCIG